ncbi:MAG: uncharacterized protein QOG15_1682 [Solirubrobacteraceae bacterium]|jgi:uncharacterized protein (DUF1684 family)|nr:uncharacterized protein [Solirubrobacteraceae bacterium]
MPAIDPTAVAELLDYRRRVAELYAEVRAARDPQAAHARWRAARRELFETHPQSPLPASERGQYEGPHVWEYDASWRVLASVEPAPAEAFELPSSDGATMRFVRVGRACSERVSLDLFWLESYGGGLFVPFADATSGSETYGAGRYVLDTIKGADLGVQDGLLVLDLNFAYQPSCSYDTRWACPLAPPGHRVDVPVRAGERLTAS